MASQAKRMWLHDEDNTIKVLPYTTIDSVKIQPNVNEDTFTDFEDDYNNVKTTITRNKNLADSSINNLDARVSVLEQAAGSSESLGLASHSAHGLMSKNDKIKLDGIDEEANNYVLPRATENILGGVKADGTTTTIDNDGTIHAVGGRGGGATTLESLSNVQIRALLDGDILMYDHKLKKWVNTFPESAGGGYETDIDYVSFDEIISLFNDEDTTYIYDLNKAY